MGAFFKIIVIVILFFVALGVGKSVVDQAGKFRDISKVEQKATVLEKERAQFQKEIAELQTAFALEKEARDKLGYQKPGEVLYVVELDKVRQEEKREQMLPNWKLWWNLVIN